MVRTVPDEIVTSKQIVVVILKDVECPAEVAPVYDSRGNFYINFCEALRRRVRVAWNEPPGD